MRGIEFQTEKVIFSGLFLLSTRTKLLLCRLPVNMRDAFSYFRVIDECLGTSTYMIEPTLLKRSYSSLALAAAARNLSTSLNSVSDMYNGVVLTRVLRLRPDGR